MIYSATYDPADDKLRLTASARLDAELYARVKKAHFRWAPKQELFFAVWNPVAEDLCVELAGEIGDEDTTLVERAEARAERFEGYQEHRAEDADRAHAAVHAICDGIPLGQPILVGHHSERRARKDAERIENGMRKAVKMWETAEYWKSRAEGALCHAKYLERPDVRARRIKGLESDIRVYRSKFTPDPKQPAILQHRWNDSNDAPKVPHVWCAPRGGKGGSWVPVESLPGIERCYSRWITHCENRLVYERAMLNEQGAADLLKPKPRSAKAQLPICNYRAPGGELDIESPWRRGEIERYTQVEMLQADYAKIDTDYKGTRTVSGSHRVRICVQRNHSRVCVFLTDSKTHIPPEPIDRKPIEPKPRAVYTPELPNPEGEKFKQLAGTLKAGVKVVSAPQLFPTPMDLARRMAGLADCAGRRVLEPSAGTGNLIRALIDNATGADCVRIVAVEINYDLVRMLTEQRQKTVYANEANFVIHHGDFLERTSGDCTGGLGGLFDRIVMNPPFENGQDIKHIKHAWEMLKPGGRLVAVCAGGPRQERELKPVVEVYGGEWERLPEGTFKESGTGVSTVLMWMDKPKAAEGREAENSELREVVSR